MGFKDALGKGMKKVGEQANRENVKELFNKAKEKALEPKSNKALIIEGALGAAVGLAFGGAIVPILAGAAIEGVVMKQVTKRYAAKKAARENGEVKKDETPKPCRKDGPKPQ